jgi:hypothetical protein
MGNKNKLWHRTKTTPEEILFEETFCASCDDFSAQKIEQLMRNIEVSEEEEEDAIESYRSFIKKLGWKE